MFVLAAGYLSAGTLNEWVVGALLRNPAGLALSPADDLPRPRAMASRDEDLAYGELLTDRNVFDADREAKLRKQKEPPPPPPPPAPEEEATGPLPETELNLELLGTTLADQPEFSLATVAFEGEHQLVQEGSELKKRPEDVSALAQVLEIHARHLLMLEGGEKRVVRLWADPKPEPQRKRGSPRRKARKTRRARRVSKKQRSAYQEGIHKVSLYRYEVSRGMLEEQLADLSAIGRQARIVPNYRGGKYEGFKLVGVRPGSLYRALGIRSGDIVHRVNGQEIDSPNKAMALLQALRNESEVELGISRRGQRRSLNYRIK